MKINVPKLTYCNAETPFCSCSIRTDHIVSINAKKADERHLAAISTPIRTHSPSHLRFSRRRKLKESNILINRKQRDNLIPFCFDAQCLKVWVISQHIFCISCLHIGRDYGVNKGYISMGEQQATCFQGMKLVKW